MAKVLRNHYSKLSYATENNLQVIANEMYSKELISREVRKAPTLEKIEIEFLVIASLYKEDIVMLKEKCLVFLQCLASVEGPAEKEAIALAKDWEHQVFQCNHLSFLVHQMMMASSPNIVLNSGDDVAKELAYLNKTFSLLITDIRKFYATSRKHDVVDIGRWVEEYIDEIDNLAHDSVTIDEIFRKMKPHYNLLDIELIQDLIDLHPIDDTVLQSRFDDYVKNRSRFIQLAKVSDLMTSINTLFIQESSDHSCKLILKLSGEWSKQSICNIRKLIEYFFGDKSKYLTFDRFLPGSIEIHFVILPSKIAETLVCIAQAKAQYMHHLGIFQLIINNQTVINRDENVNFCFEESLRYAITNINNIDGIDYESMFFFFFSWQ